MKAIIKIVTAQKQFSSQDLDVFRRMLNVLHEHDLAASLTMTKKTKVQFDYNTKLRKV